MKKVGFLIFCLFAMCSMAGVFAIDVNGKRGPNKWGHDVFSFAFNEKEPGIIEMQPVCQLIEKGGRHSNNLLINISK